MSILAWFWWGSYAQVKVLSDVDCRAPLAKTNVVFASHSAAIQAKTNSLQMGVSLFLNKLNMCAGLETVGNAGTGHKLLTIIYTSYKFC